MPLGRRRTGGERTGNSLPGLNTSEREVKSRRKGRDNRAEGHGPAGRANQAEGQRRARPANLLASPRGPRPVAAAARRGPPVGKGPAPSRLAGVQGPREPGQLTL